jgi:hypothetical protein
MFGNVQQKRGILRTAWNVLVIIFSVLFCCVSPVHVVFSRAEIACRVCCDSCLHHDEIVQSEPDGPGIMPRIPSSMKGPGKV